MDRKSAQFLTESRDSPKDLELISTRVRIAEVSTKLFEEKEDYPVEELISETGGSLGVFLGLRLVHSKKYCSNLEISIIDVVVFGRGCLKQLFAMLCRMWRRLQRRCCRKRVAAEMVRVGAYAKCRAVDKTSLL